MVVHIKCYFSQFYSGGPSTKVHLICALVFYCISKLACPIIFVIFQINFGPSIYFTPLSQPTTTVISPFFFVNWSFLLLFISYLNYLIVRSMIMIIYGGYGHFSIQLKGMNWLPRRPRHDKLGISYFLL